MGKRKKRIITPEILGEKEPELEDDIETIDDEYLDEPEEDVGESTTPEQALEEQGEIDPLDQLELDDGLVDAEWGIDAGQTPLEKHSDLLKELTDFDPFLRDLVNGWLGRVWNEETKKTFIDPDLEPIMNAKGAGWCVSFLKTYARKNNIITTIGENSYKYLIHDVIDTVGINIGTRSKEFGIKKDGDIIRICTELEHTCQLVLMGAGQGNYNKMLGTVTQVTEHVSRMEGDHPMARQSRGQQQAPPGFMNTVKRMWG